MVKLFLVVVLCFLSYIHALSPEFYALKVYAVATKSPVPAITVKWEDEKCTTSYRCQNFKLYKGIYNSSSLSLPTFSLLAQLSNTSSSYVDLNVTVGQRYVYNLVRLNYSPTTPLQPETTLMSGIEVPAVDYFGKIFFVVEGDMAQKLSTLVQQAEDDMIGDGWSVVRITVYRNYTVEKTKNLIRQAYLANPDARAVYLFGRIPVPYSGSVAPDGHSNHIGAWPADIYYGDAVENGVWTDNINYGYYSSYPRQNNTAGDGKFDQSYLYSSFVQELEVGRVDLSNMGSANETDLLQKYLIKAHNFRHAITSFKRRGLVRDSFGEFGGEAFAQNGWKAFNVMFGKNNTINYLSSTGVLNNASTDDYLFFYGTGGGSSTSMSGTGSTTDFFNLQPKFVFTMLFGSYFGDWEFSNSFLKAPLAAGTGLTSVWGGRPNWSFYHMALGYNVGRSAWHSQMAGKQIHMALMGDPTLRLFVVAPPSNLVSSQISAQVRLNWAASPDSKVIGYHVYRAATKFQKFTRLTLASSPITTLYFSDGNPIVGASVYMVRAVKLEVSPSGSYLNPSQGIFVSAKYATPTSAPTTTPFSTRSPTSTPTILPTPSPTRSPTPTPTPISTRSPTSTPISTHSPTPTPISTRSPTPTLSPTSKPTTSPTPTLSPTTKPTTSPISTKSPLTARIPEPLPLA